MRTVRGGLVELGLVLVLALASGKGAAADGGLDPSFGRGGIATSPAIALQAAAVQPNGRIVAVGADKPIVAIVGVGDGTPAHFRMARLLADGSPDRSFGNDGVVGDDCASCVGSWQAIALQGDGRIVVAALTESATPGPQTVFSPETLVARYLANGQPDPSFPVANPFGEPAYVTRARSLPGDKTLLLGDSANEDRVLLARIDRNGALDTSFGSGGRVAFDVGLDGLVGGAGQVAFESGGKIVLACDRFDRATGRYRSSLLVRFLADGRRDPSFGSGGVVEIDLGNELGGGSILTIGPDGKILVGAGGTDLVIARYDARGTLDPTFGTGGIARVTPTLFLVDFFVQPDGKIVAVGEGSEGFAVARFDRRGSVDETFGRGGRVSTEATGDALARAGFFVAGGKVLVAGTLATSSVVVRFVTGRSVVRRRPLPTRSAVRAASRPAILATP